MLPKIAPIIYTLKLPSSGETLSFRPFLVKEEKALLLAQQSEDLSTMIATLKEVITACTFGKIDTNKLATFDIEYLFAKIRAKSVGEIVELTLKCDTCTDDKAQVLLGIDLNKLEVVKSAEHNKKIQLFGDVGVVLKYPGFDMMKENIDKDFADVNVIFSLVNDLIDYIYDKDTIYPANEHTKEELNSFIENLTAVQFAKLQNFFTTMPTLEYKIEYVCPICQKKHEKVISGIQSFF